MKALNPSLKRTSFFLRTLLRVYVAFFGVKNPSLAKTSPKLALGVLLGMASLLSTAVAHSDHHNLDLSLRYQAPERMNQLSVRSETTEIGYRPTRRYTIVEQPDGSLRAVEGSAAQANHLWLDRMHNGRELGRQNAAAVRKLLRRGARQLYDGMRNGAEVTPNFGDESHNRFAGKESKREYDLRVSGSKVKLSMEMNF